MEKYKKIWDQSVIKVVLITFFCGIVIHLFSLVNVLHNYDDISVQSGYGVGILSGRWVLTVLGDFIGKIWGNYNLPYVNGIVFILLLAISAGVLFSIFELKSWKMGALMGVILVSFPSVTSTLFFKYTVVYYGLGILLSVVAVWTMEKMKNGIVASALCIALAAGIYQAFVPITISLFVLLLLKKTLESKITFKDFFVKGVTYCCSIAGGMILYFVSLNICLKVYHTSLDSYQGVSEMGKLQLSSLPSLLKRTVSDFFKLPVSDYCNLAPTDILKIGFLLLGCICVFIILKQIIKKGDLSRIGMVLIIGIVFPIAVNFIVIMCPNSTIYTLMVYSFVVVLFVPIVVLNSIKIYKYIKIIIICILVLMSLNYSYLANVNYMAMYYANRQTENYLNAMVTQVRMTEGYDSTKKWVFVGNNINDPLFHNSWGNIPMFGGNRNDYINAYSRMEWVEKYVGYLVPLEDNEIILNEVGQSEPVKEMPCWPNEGSIKVIDDRVVIKLEK